MCSVSVVGKNKKFSDIPFTYHQEIELEITTLTNLGSGLGRVQLPGAQLPALGSQLTTEPPSAAGGGWVVMVPFTLPVLVEVLFGRTLQISLLSMGRLLLMVVFIPVIRVAP